jgi:aspartate oxidase
VYSDKIYHYLAENSNDKNQNIKFVQDWKSEAVNEIDPNYLSKTKSEIQLLMRKSAGIVRNDKDLNTAKIKLHYFQKEIEEQINNQGDYMRIIGSTPKLGSNNVAEMESTEPIRMNRTQRPIEWLIDKYG